MFGYQSFGNWRTEKWISLDHLFMTFKSFFGSLTSQGLSTEDLREPVGSKAKIPACGPGFLIFVLSCLECFSRRCCFGNFVISVNEVDQNLAGFQFQWIKVLILRLGFTFFQRFVA